jgi:hypothetical protein
MVALKLECLKIPIEIGSGLRIELIILRVKVDRLMRVPMNEKKSGSMGESWNVLKTLSIRADTIVVEEEKEETLIVEDS